MSEQGPETQPSGALTPPPRHPPTALATSAPFPRHLSGRPALSRVPRQWMGLRGLMESALDGLDAIADRFAEAAGLR
jgi:hypothetical protein